MMLKEKIKNKKLMGVPFLGKYVFLKYDDTGSTKKIGGRPFSGKRFVP
jgi:hypothetical protein